MRATFRLLGSVEVVNGSGPVDIGPARERGTLAALLLDANRYVSTDQLVARVWGDRRLPVRPRRAVQTYVSLLRRALAEIGDVAIVRRADGYLIAVDEDLTDVGEFRTLVARARATSDPDLAAALYERALGLWRGDDALSGLDMPWFDCARAALRQERHAAERDLADVQLRRGRHGALLGRLSEWVGEHPLDERLVGQLMLALVRAGRQADALRHYQLLRERLSDELGADPGRALQQLHQRILTGDPTLAVPDGDGDAGAAADEPAQPATEPATEPVTALVTPRQLPAALRLFTGRTRELAALDAVMDARDEPDLAVNTVAISGPAGVGKTALAVWWAHRLADRFPDGQLYADLRGRQPGRAPVTPDEAVRWFLSALGVGADRMPRDPEARAGLYRSLLACRRVLILLDDALDAEQVRPLLPGTAGCAVVVTSRDRMTGLVAGGAHPLPLSALGRDEAYELFVRRVGARRAAAEPDAVEQLITWCAGSPAALTAAAATAATRPDHPLTTLATALTSTLATAPTPTHPTALRAERTAGPTADRTTDPTAADRTADRTASRTTDPTAADLASDRVASRMAELTAASRAANRAADVRAERTAGLAAELRAELAAALAAQLRSEVAAEPRADPPVEFAAESRAPRRDVVRHGDPSSRVRVLGEPRKPRHKPQAPSTGACA